MAGRASGRGVVNGYHVRAQRRGFGDWYGVIVRPDGAWLWSCEHAHTLSITARACADVELDDRKRADRRRMAR